MPWARSCRPGLSTRIHLHRETQRPKRLRGRSRRFATTRVFSRGMMNRRTNVVFAVAVLLLAMLAGCTTSKKHQQSDADGDISRVVTLPDGSTCMEPAGLAESREKPGAIALREL